MQLRGSNKNSHPGLLAEERLNVGLDVADGGGRPKRRTAAEVQEAKDAAEAETAKRKAEEEESARKVARVEDELDAAENAKVSRASSLLEQFLTKHPPSTYRTLREQRRVVLEHEAVKQREAGAVVLGRVPILSPPSTPTPLQSHLQPQTRRASSLLRLNRLERSP